MYRRTEGRHIFMALAICLFLFSPLVIFFEPLIVAETLYYERGVWITQVPKINFMLCGIAMLLLILAFVALWLMNMNKLSIVLAFLCTCGCIVLIHGGSLSYASLSGEAITFRHAFSQDKQSYTWDSIDSIHYFDDLENDDVQPFYVFYFPDGEELQLKKNGLLTEEIRIRIDQKIRELNIPFERIHEW
ncbi:hypothetical protein [Psychrobacillus sp. L3]|uniref:hypothetical protein n=1 Tax=Psychrobacillus sp. L3 TaxID=3236891 RepID=UPI0036F3F371